METDCLGSFVKSETTSCHSVSKKSSKFNENLLKQLFHSQLLDMRLLIANSALHGTSLAIYHTHGIIVKYSLNILLLRESISSTYILVKQLQF